MDRSRSDQNQNKGNNMISNGPSLLAASFADGRYSLLPTRPYHPSCTQVLVDDAGCRTISVIPVLMSWLIESPLVH